MTGSNSVNVFFGLGLPWVVAAIYWSNVGPTEEWKRRYPQQALDYPDGGFVVLSGDLGFSVTVFTCVACITIGLVLVRRYIGSPPGELGGSATFARGCAAFLVLLWFLYVGLSTLSAYGYISIMQEHPSFDAHPHSHPHHLHALYWLQLSSARVSVALAGCAV